MTKTPVFVLYCCWDFMWAVIKLWIILYEDHNELLNQAEPPALNYFLKSAHLSDTIIVGAYTPSVCAVLFVSMQFAW